MNNFYLSCKECILESPRRFYGCFYLGPFNNSQSLTIANALRRTLLSEISGLGILSVEIEGVNHEYSTFLGMRESVLDFLLNLKEIVLSYNSDPIYPIGNSRNKLGYLSITGPGVVRASDLKLPSFLKCVDPEQYLATLSENGKLHLKFEISENFDKLPGNTLLGIDNRIIGERLLNRSLNLARKNSHRIFQLDPVFTPITSVNYTIEPYETFDENYNLEVIYLELWTNGSIHPRDALYKALNILNNMIAKIAKMKLLNNIYRKSIFKSNQHYSKVQKKTFYNINFKRLSIAKNII